MQSCFADRKARLEAFRKAELYLVISSEFTLGRPVPEIFEAAAAGGIRLIQLREKNRGAKFLYDTACACRSIANRYNVVMMIDDMVDVALLSGADGVHLGQEDLPVNEARKIAPELLLGCSTHNLEEALAARSAGADYINIGPVYPTGTKKLAMEALGTGAIRSISPQIAPLPSLLPSLTSISSKSAKDCPRMLSTHSLKYFSTLYTGITTLKNILLHSVYHI